MLYKYSILPQTYLKIFRKSFISTVPSFSTSAASFCVPFNSAFLQMLRNVIRTSPILTFLSASTSPLIYSGVYASKLNSFSFAYFSAAEPATPHIFIFSLIPIFCFYILFHSCNSHHITCGASLFFYIRRRNSRCDYDNLSCFYKLLHFCQLNRAVANVIILQCFCRSLLRLPLLKDLQAVCL